MQYKKTFTLNKLSYFHKKKTITNQKNQIQLRMKPWKFLEWEVWMWKIVGNGKKIQKELVNRTPNS
jgi:hypothetical protein